MEVRSLHPLFAAELVGADLTRAPSPELVALVEDAMAQYGVLAIRDAEISDEQHKDFSRAFGPLEIPSRVPGAARPQGTRQITPGIFYAGNLDHNGEIIPYGSDPKSLAKGAERFHTDSRQTFFALAAKFFRSGRARWFPERTASCEILLESIRCRAFHLRQVLCGIRSRQYAEDAIWFPQKAKTGLRYNAMLAMIQ